jgi:hypothetical protein
MSACHGSWEPNSTVSSPSLNVTDCTDTTPTCKSPCKIDSGFP